MEFIKLHGCAHDLTGRRFGRLVALGPVERIFIVPRGTAIKWLCRCDCGKDVSVLAQGLRTGNTKSCGCYNLDRIVQRSTKHGLTKLPEFWVWIAAKRRCHSPRDKSYHRYGGRGIHMCLRWRDDFGAFMQDMGPRPTPEHTLERLNNDLGYDPANCAWRLPIVQANNKRNNRFVEVFGRRQTISQWAREMRLAPGLIRQRLECGWTPEEAMSRPDELPQDRCLLTAFGKTQTFAQWSAESGIAAELIRGRITKQGWNAERAITAPCDEKRGGHMHRRRKAA